MVTLVIGCGFVGRELGRRLAVRGERVLGTTRHTEKAAALARLGIEPVVADVLDLAALRALPEVDRVIHLVGYDRKSGPSKRSVYVEGVANVLRALAGRCGRAVYVSSTSVYGQSDGGWVDEDSPAEPREASGRVCLDAEHEAARVAAEAGMALSVVRFSGLYGPGRIIRREALLRGEPIEGDAEHWLNLIHRDDAAEAAIAVLERGAPGRLYLATDDRPVPRRAYYELAARCLGAPAPRFVAPGLGGHPAMTGASKRVSNRRLREELGVSLAFPDITAGLPSAVAAE